MWKFGIKKRDLERVSSSLKKACLRRREEDCADRLDQSFGTTYTKTDDGGNYAVTVSGGDAIAFISATHTREDGGANWNNRVTDGTTVNMDMDYDALKAAYRTASLILDPKGKKMDINLDTLIVTRGNAVAFRAKEILGAIKAGGKGSIPGSADNDAASVNAFKVIELPYVETNLAFWWMFDSSMLGQEYGLQYKESQGIQLEGPNVVFKTGKVFALYLRKLVEFASQIRWNSCVPCIA